MNDQQPEPATDTGTLARLERAAKEYERTCHTVAAQDGMDHVPPLLEAACKHAAALPGASLSSLLLSATLAERAQIVSWLREKKWQPLGGDDLEFLLERIEKGEHLEEIADDMDSI